jgi:tetratricopeptide (TPR) repeat protein
LPGGLFGQGSRPGSGTGVGSSLPGQGGNLAGGGIRPVQGGADTQWPGGNTRPGQGGSGQQWPGGNRPFPGGIANRPGQGGSGEQWSGGNRPFPGGIANRPGQGGSGEQWPGGNRPFPGGIANWPGGNYRPGQGGSWSGNNNGTRPRPGGIFGNGNNNVFAGGGNVNTGNIGSGNTVNNITNTTNNTVLNNNQNWVSSNRVGGWGGTYGAYAGGWGYRNLGYYNGAYGNWYSGSWSGWPSTPYVWAGASAVAGWLGAAQSYTYSNPFVSNLVVASDDSGYSYANAIPTYVDSQSSPAVVVNATVGDTAYFNTGQTATDVPATPGIIAPPAEVPATTTAQSPPEDPKVKEVVALFDEGRELFKLGDYAGAEHKVDRAIRVLPADAALHEFRALTLFAQGKYKQAAETLYAVMSAGPGWNWDTLRQFYPDRDTYTRQLRALEADARENLKSADDRFVLAYHYLVMGHHDAAEKVLDQVHALLPDDQLTTQLLAALRPQPQGKDGAPQPSAG